MILEVVTIFPEMFEGPMSTSIVGSARERGLVSFVAHDLRDWTHDRHRTTDDYPYGGGPGMVMKPEPIFEAIESLRVQEGPAPTVVFMTPAGEPFSQAVAHELSACERIVFVCGRYEGFDERAMTQADREISIGDYVLTGGELPAMVVMDAIVRLVPGVLGDCESPVEESFSECLLEYPQYTRPPEFRGMEVPEVLRSGDHARIAAWRRARSVERTASRRPDLLADACLSGEERAAADSVVARDVGSREDEDV
jgi:tRNA (guanine37-N1)-methyltransferase